MSLRTFMGLYNFIWMMESHGQQRLAWDDAVQARLARDRAETRALIQHRAMMDANPSGQLGNARLNDLDVLKRSGLI